VFGHDPRGAIVRTAEDARPDPWTGSGPSAAEPTMRLRRRARRPPPAPELRLRWLRRGGGRRAEPVAGGVRPAPPRPAAPRRPRVPDVRGAALPGVPPWRVQGRPAPARRPSSGIGRRWTGDDGADAERPGNRARRLRALALLLALVGLIAAARTARIPPGVLEVAAVLGEAVWWYGRGAERSRPRTPPSAPCA